MLTVLPRHVSENPGYTHILVLGNLQMKQQLFQNSNILLSQTVINHLLYIPYLPTRLVFNTSPSFILFQKASPETYRLLPSSDFLIKIFSFCFIPILFLSAIYILHLFLGKSKYNLISR